MTGTGAPKTDEPLTIIVQNGDASQKFKVKPEQPLQKLMNAYCDMHRLDKNSVRFLTDEGVRVKGEDSVRILGLEDCSVLDVMQRQDGGGRLQSSHGPQPALP